MWVEPARKQARHSMASYLNFGPYADEVHASIDEVLRANDRNTTHRRARRDRLSMGGSGHILVPTVKHRKLRKHVDVFTQGHEGTSPGEENRQRVSTAVSA